MPRKAPKYDVAYDVALADYSNRPRALDYTIQEWYNVLRQHKISEPLEELLTTLVLKVDGCFKASELSEKEGDFCFELMATEDDPSKCTGPFSIYGKAKTEPVVFYPIRISREEDFVTVLISFRSRCEECDEEEAKRESPADLKVQMGIGADTYDWYQIGSWLSWAPMGEKKAFQLAKRCVVQKIVDTMKGAEDKKEDNKNGRARGAK